LALFFLGQFINLSIIKIKIFKKTQKTYKQTKNKQNVYVNVVGEWVVAARGGGG
jgi:hypothetical protein